MKLLIAGLLLGAFLLGLFLHTPAQACALNVECARIR